MTARPVPDRPPQPPASREELVERLRDIMIRYRASAVGARYDGTAIFAAIHGQVLDDALRVFVDVAAFNRGWPGAAIGRVPA